MREALEQFHILGVHTNIGYLMDVMSHAQFESGLIDTDFLNREFSYWTVGPIPRELGDIGAAAATKSPERSIGDRSTADEGVWGASDGFRNSTANSGSAR